MAEVITQQELKELLRDWTYLFTFGYSLDIYRFGRLRLGIDRATGKKVISYVV